MPENVDLTPEQKQQGTTETSAAAPAPEAPITRKDLEQMLAPLKSGYDGLRSLTDRRLNELQLRFQQATATRASRGVEVGEESEQPVGYDYGTDKDRALARAAARELHPDFDYSKIEPTLSDQAQAPKYLRLEADGRTFDWFSIYAEAWRDYKVKLADELLARQQQAESEEAARRAASKTQAVISGSGASYPEGTSVPSDRTEASKLTNKALVEAMLAEGYPRESLTPQMKAWLEGK